jgi:aryl-alcohol dehydrogenase-like predicted oxidoreductase
MAQSETTPAAIREKLARLEDCILADAVLNVIVKGTGIHVVVPAMMKPGHVESNVDAVTRSRFSAEETKWLRSRFRERQRVGPLQD